MSDSTSRNPKDGSRQEAPGMPSSPGLPGPPDAELTAEELSAVAAVVVVLTSAAEPDPGQAHRQAPVGGSARRSRWGAPAQLVRTTQPHGPGGWRASALPG